MAHREFTDADGIRWQAWEVIWSDLSDAELDGLARAAAMAPRTLPG